MQLADRAVKPGLGRNGGARDVGDSSGSGWPYALAATGNLCGVVACLALAPVVLCSIGKWPAVR
eukprot:12500593-Alexandrium_andersonii.AAC.1